MGNVAFLSLVVRRIRFRVNGYVVRAYCYMNRTRPPLSFWLFFVFKMLFVVRGRVLAFLFLPRPLFVFNPLPSSPSVSQRVLVSFVNTPPTPSLYEYGLAASCPSIASVFEIYHHPLLLQLVFVSARAVPSLSPR